MRSLLRRWLAAPAEQKSSRARPMVALQRMGRPVWTDRDGEALAREGYRRNAIVYRCVRLIAESAAATDLFVTGDGEAEHPALALLRRPNLLDSGRVFLEALFGHLLISGNAYIELVSLDGVPRAMNLLRPDRMRVIPGADAGRSPTSTEPVRNGSVSPFPRKGRGACFISRCSIAR